MADDEWIDLHSVNWTEGMFLTPDHFLRHERYIDSLWLWLVRYGIPTAGLIGGGARVDPSERGAAKYDPIVDIDDGPDALKVTVTQCRGLSSGGAIIDIDPSRPLRESFPKTALEGVLDVGIYVVAHPHDKEPDDSIADPVNPQLQLGRRYRYGLKLDVTAEEAERALLLARLRRAEKGLRFEPVADFIPPCAFMSSHSALMQAFRQINQSVAAIAERYSRLHRAIVDFVSIARSRGIGVDEDVETLEFVSRMVMTLEACAYEVLDPLQSSRRFFQQMTRLIRSSALFLSLSPPTQEYFRLLGEIGEVEFVAMLRQEGEALEMGRSWSIHEDLGIEVQKVARALERLDRLEQALEGKYLDYRVSPSLERLNFVFDRTGSEPVLYRAVAKPARPQAHGQELTFVFAPLRLEAREMYRVILVGDGQARFVAGERLTTELRINPGGGYRHPPEFLTAEHEIPGQRNFAVDFRAPADAVTITDLRVSLRSSQPIRSAILYVRGRLLRGRTAPGVVRQQLPADERADRRIREDRPEPSAGPTDRPVPKKGRLSDPGVR